jgi:hypothetical protein
LQTSAAEAFVAKGAGRPRHPAAVDDPARAQARVTGRLPRHRGIARDTPAS